MEEKKSLTPSFDGKFDYNLGLDLPEGICTDKDSVKDNARSFKIIHKNGSGKAVLCLQGYQGYPGEMAAFAKRLYMAGFDVWAPRNPGMGTTWEDFYRSNDRQWLDSAKFYCKALMEKYGEENLYLAGHSMGCALCALCAKDFPVKKMVLFAPGIGENVISDRQRRQLKLVKPFKKRIPTPWQHDDSYHFEYEAGVEADLALGAEYWSFITPSKFLDADKLFKSSYQVLPSLETKTLVFSGGKDPLISKSMCDDVASRIKNSKHIHLEKCTHGIPYDIDLPSMDRAFSEAVKFFNEG
ncbi:MAG: alpha/beta fold hydrolase [Sphaerochaetaceae bacterium]|nr:alpha/beta fold hydrolase [Sphaerochaetaceae bacterium]